MESADKYRNLKDRMKRFALDVIRFCHELPSTRENGIFSNQLIRCASSVGANYRAACRSRSTADFIAKLSIVEEEADEAIYWLELLEETSAVDLRQLQSLKQEAGELIAITVASKKTARSHSTRHSTLATRH